MVALPVAPLWCDLGLWSRTVVVVKLRRTSAFTVTARGAREHSRSIGSELFIPWAPSWRKGKHKTLRCKPNTFALHQVCK